MMLKTKDLAKYLSEKSNGEYFIYEMEDFLEIFSESLKELIFEEQEVQFGTLGVFKPKYTKTRKGFSGLKGEYIDIQGGMTLKFSPGRSFQKELREKYLSKQKESKDE